MNLKEFDIVTEGIGDGMVTLYHGSEHLFKTLEPTALDFGNAFVKPGWSLFCWKTYEEACSWAVWRAVSWYLTELKDSGKIAEDAKLSKYITWDPGKSRAKMTQSGFDFIKSTMIANPNIKYPYGYVYTLKSKRKYVSIGNDASHKEYTTREPHIKPEHIDKIKINEENIMKHILILPDDEYQRFNSKESWDWMNRGLTSLLLTRDFSYNGMVNMPSLNRIRKDMRDGLLKPGDDLEAYMYKKGVSIAHLSPLKRIKLQMTGLKKGREY